MNAIQTAANNLPDSPWVWRTHDGMRLTPDQMKTTHLFYTLRMIWNHRMPAEAHVGYNVKRWNLTMPDSYLAEAIVRMADVLSRRSDLPSWMQRELNQMAAYFERKPELLRFVPSLTVGN